jgi:hypothetical protein
VETSWKTKEEKLKAKTAFEVSGNSPTATVKVSENGAPIQTGRGLEETKRRIMEAFEGIRQHLPASPPQPQAYTEEHEVRFRARAKKLTVAALTSWHMMKAARSNVFEIAVPTGSAEQLIAEAIRRFS